MKSIETNMSNPIEVLVKTAYLEEQSSPDNKQFVFSYTITITNHGNRTAQLISRRWHIVDANDEVQEVQGLGVIGQQPVLNPATSYTYTSGAILETATGMMSGAYVMRYDNGEEFEAPIPAFALVQPHALH